MQFCTIGKIYNSLATRKKAYRDLQDKKQIIDFYYGVVKTYSSFFLNYVSDISVLFSINRQ